MSNLAGNIAGVIYLILIFGIPAFTLWYIINSTSPEGTIKRQRQERKRKGLCNHETVRLGGGMWDDLGTCDGCGAQAYEEKFWRFESKFYRIVDGEKVWE